ncbi:MAG: 3-isopropylmalate dehydrogenase [Alphaproteobacteria bacterium]|nr:MAG: 3-isopropylmalate dehydrogenase [Alphaproteobacteria bacterium]
MAKILLLPGDGIGPEVLAAARIVLDRIAACAGLAFRYEEALIGGAAIERHGVPLPDATLTAARAADAVLLGAVGGPQWNDLPGPRRPEAGLLALRAGLGLYANLRPIRVRTSTVAATPLRPEIARGTDMLFVRELTGGLYFGAKRRDAEAAEDVCCYTRDEIARVVRRAAALARARRGKLTLIDKANVLETSRLWRAVTGEIIGADYADLDFEILLVDAAAMYLMTRPRDFDVIVTENLFGDILTDEASVLAGSIGLIGSASLGDGRRGLYEPVHGSAPDIAGQGIANPLGMIESVAMMLELGFDRPEEAALVREAVDAVLAQGVRSHDLGGDATTMAIATVVADRLSEIRESRHDADRIAH